MYIVSAERRIFVINNLLYIKNSNFLKYCCVTDHAGTFSMDEPPVKVKQEKIDPEIELRIQELQKAEVVDEKPNNIKEEQESSDSNSTSDSNAGEDEPEDKKNIEVVKTSNELLAELFQVFNAAPPEELLNDEDLLKKTQRKSKKHKKEKKKKRKRHKENVDDEDSGNKSDIHEDGIKKEKQRHKKKKKHKHKDDEKHKAKEKELVRSKSKDMEKELEKKKSKEHEHEQDDKSSKRMHESVTDELHMKKERDDDVHRKDEGSRKRHNTVEVKKEPPAKVHVSMHEKRSSKSFYNDGHDEHEKEHASKIKSESRRNSSDRSKRHGHASKDHWDRNEMSDISLSDEETYLRERDRIGGSLTSGEQRRRQSYQTHQRRRNRHSSDHYRRDSRSRSKKRSRSRDLGIDKKRLLEIARKNVISMFKRGNLPGCANMTEDVKDKVLLQMRYGGRTVQDLTDFCRKISNGEPLSSMSSDNDSDVDKDGNTKAFHHPFQLKERDPIVMHLRSSKPMPVSATSKPEDLTKAITMQFPVSSGQQHRISESWMPIEAKPLASLPPLPAATQSTSIFNSNVQKNVFEKTLPAAERQEPAFRPVITNETKMDNNATNSAGTETAPNYTNPASQIAVTQPFPDPQPKPDGFVPDVPIPSSNPSISVFPESNLSASFDVSSIISKRLSALRRLQENPMDSEAKNMMNNSQKEMSSWASSKFLPGQFTGSTGANVLKAHELNSGPQVWARRDQLTSTKPVTGGMGMHLLQKMGWKPGEGLGREKSGALQPLLLDVKLDKRGLVAKDDHSVMNGGVRNPVGGGSKKRPNNANDAMQNFQNKHPVCILNELTSKRKWTPPLYLLVSEGGPSHSKQFLFSVSMNGQTYTPTEGANTKKEAKMLAAKFCLEQIGVLPVTQT